MHEKWTYLKSVNTQIMQAIKHGQWTCLQQQTHGKYTSLQKTDTRKINLSASIQATENGYVYKHVDEDYNNF